MPLEVNYLIAANDSNLLGVDKHDYEYIDVAPSKQIPLCFPRSNTKEPNTFDVLVELMLLKEGQRLNSKEITGQTFEMLRCRLNGHVLAFFSGKHASDINHRRIGEFISYLQEQEIGAISLISNHFKKILDSGNMAIGVNGEKRSLYSLRHTAITFRLLYGSGIDLLTLARNARTSVEMIERFYSSNLTAEMNIGLLHSKRSHGTLNKKISNI